MLKIDRLEKTYIGDAGEIHALKGVSLDVQRGEIKALLGRSGSGKSTLLRLCAGHDTPSGGGLYFEGVPVNGASHERFMVFQDLEQLFPWMRVSNNIIFALRSVYPGLAAGEAAEQAEYWLEETGMAGCGRLWPAELSGGMHQRATLARAFAIRPKLLLLDEPFSALDVLLRRAMQKLLVSLCKRHAVGVLFVTHDIDEAMYLDARPAIITPDGSFIIRSDGSADVRKTILQALGEDALEGSF